MEFKYKTREEWLTAAVKLMEPHFKKASYTIPEVRVSVGFSLRSGLKAAGCCWAAEAASDKRPQIFVSPTQNDEPSNEYAVLPVLVHELVHAVVGIEAKHGPDFKACAEAVGLTGKMTSTVASDDLKPTLALWREQLGPYPHVILDPKRSPKKKQTTRMFKCECKCGGEDNACGYMVRISRKWIDEIGVPRCPKHGKTLECDYIPEPKEPVEDPNRDTHHVMVSRYA